MNTDTDIPEISEIPELIGFKDEIATIKAAIDSFESGKKQNIAIIGEPFGGRTTLVNEIQRLYPQKVTNISFSSIVKNINEIVLPDQKKGIIILDHCECLYMRKIGGFSILDEFLRSITFSDNIFITTWNIYSWNYLDAILNLSKYFDTVVQPTKLSPIELKECFLSRYGENEIQFVEDAAFQKEKPISFQSYPLVIKHLKKPINIPRLKINYHELRARFAKTEEKIAVQDMIFRKIHNISNGNPGVAKALWQKSIEYPTIKPSWVKDLSFSIDLDYNESFILAIILSVDVIKDSELSEIAGPDFKMGNILFRLMQQELITVNEGSCSIRPEALRSIVDFLKRLRLVW